MNDVKWIRISTDIFDNWKIKQIKAMPEGYRMICVWFQLLCLCGKCNESGLIVLSGKVVANDELLSNIFGEDLKIIQLSLRTFEAFGMIEVSDEGITEIKNWGQYQNTDGLEKIREYERIRKAKQREKKREIEDKNCPGQSPGQCPGQCPGQVPEMSRDSSISISYSFLNKSNIYNLNNILNNNSQEYIYILNNKELLKAIRDWMEYKDQKKPKSQNHYDSERGMRGFLNKVMKASEEYGAREVIDVINDSIASNYQGVTWDRIGRRKNTGKPNTFKNFSEREYDYDKLEAQLMGK